MESFYWDKENTEWAGRLEVDLLETFTQVSLFILRFPPSIFLPIHNSLFVYFSMNINKLVVTITKQSEEESYTEKLLIIYNVSHFNRKILSTTHSYLANCPYAAVFAVMLSVRTIVAHQTIPPDFYIYANRIV